jgi:RNA polymerase sigma factor (sigma-70 family)
MTDVYDRYGKLAYSIVYRIIHHPQTAEDLVQEVFLRLWNRILDFDSKRGSLALWIVCMARSRALDHVRSAEWKLRKTFASLSRRSRVSCSSAPGFPRSSPTVRSSSGLCLLPERPSRRAYSVGKIRAPCMFLIPTLT